MECGAVPKLTDQMLITENTAANFAALGVLQNIVVDSTTRQDAVASSEKFIHAFLHVVSAATADTTTTHVSDKSDSGLAAADDVIIRAASLFAALCTVGEHAWPNARCSGF
jgi:hypothetical protein